jgi:multidrug efflux pump
VRYAIAILLLLLVVAGLGAIKGAILMTTAATVAGHFTLTLVRGPGAAARTSIGIVLVGGMTIGTLFTLFVVPSLYVLIAKEHSRRREAAAAAPTSLEPA